LLSVANDYSRGPLAAFLADVVGAPQDVLAPLAAKPLRRRAA
jgi:hypothetical protein